MFIPISRLSKFSPKPKTNKLQHFSEMLGIQHLDVSHLRGRAAGKNNHCDDEQEKEPAEDKRRAKEEAESTEEVKTSDRAGRSSKGGRVKKDRADRRKKAKTRTWSDVVKGLEPEDESGATDSDKSWNESETVDSVQQTDSEEPDQFKAKQTRMQRKSMPSRRNRRIGKRRSHSSEGAERGLLSRHTDREGRGAQNKRGHGKQNQTGRGARARRSDARRSRLEEPTATEADTRIQPQVELEGEC